MEDLQTPPVPEFDSEHFNRVCQYTSGKWDDEASSADELDKRLASLPGLFTVWREVTGEYVQPRYLAEKKQPRIDRLLLPTTRFIESGWTYGAVGIECKCSNMKLGTVIAQCQDYGRALFKIPKLHITVNCEWIFVWPLQQFGGDVASIMTQNRIGGAWGAGWNKFQLKTACANLLMVDKHDKVEIGKVAAGKRTGSR